MKRSIIGFVLLSAAIIVISISVRQQFFQIPIRPEIPISLLEKCEPQALSVSARKNNKSININVNIKGRERGLCVIEYVKPGGIDVVNTHSYLYNEKGNLCAYHDFFTKIELSGLFCDFISL